ncbi:MAG: hydrolase TatD [Bacteroidetes bacterium]|nr:hydrolase TatD [Bacteroidota bacterium]MDF2453933.1 hydrolase TatD [Bacteroidota bacterium]
MTKTIPYINIHTHHLSKDDGVFLFNNRFGFDNTVYSDSFFSVGIHPWDADTDISMDEFEKWIQHTNCLAIGECGLDKLKGPDPEMQKEKFIQQLDLAVKYQKPVIIHCVKAFDELIDICRPYQTKIPLMIHGFNKSQELALQLIGHGFYLSFNHIIFKKENFDFCSVPLNKTFLETDTNANVAIHEIYDLASNHFNVEIDNLKEEIYRNFTDIFLRNGR